MEVVGLRFGLVAGATRRARQYRTHREAKLVVEFLYVSLEEVAAFLSRLLLAPLSFLERFPPRLDVADHVARNVLHFTHAVVVQQRSRHLQGLALALLLGESVAGDELLRSAEHATLGTGEVVPRLVVEVAAETANCVAVFVRCLRIFVRY